MAWNTVTKDETEQSPHYGLKGWLLALWIACLLAIVLNLWPVIAFLLNADAPSLNLPISSYVIFSVVTIILSLPFAILAPRKSQLTPLVTICCIWVWLTSVLIFFLHIANEEGYSFVTLAPLVFILVVIGSSLTGYFRRSKRVNMTFRHQVREI